MFFSIGEFLNHKSSEPLPCKVMLDCIIKASTALGITRVEFVDTDINIVPAIAATLVYRGSKIPLIKFLDYNKPSVSLYDFTFHTKIPMVLRHSILFAIDEFIPQKHDFR